MGDNFSHDENPTLALYRPYNMFLPSKQVRLPQLWDDIGLPHDREKQEYGRTLVITGFLVDPDAMSILLSSDRLLGLLELVSAVTDFVFGSPARGEGRRHKLRDWLHLVGWMSWALIVCHLLRPALSSAYCKVAGNNLPNAGIFVNAEVKRDFSWFADVFRSFSGIRILRSLAWGLGEADL
jgi:hypothetical protein